MPVNYLMTAATTTKQEAGFHATRDARVADICTSAGAQ
jgi:hypothetical protein